MSFLTNRDTDLIEGFNMSSIEQYLDITILDHLKDEVAQHGQSVKPDEEILYAFLKMPETRDEIADTIKIDWFINMHVSYCMQIMLPIFKGGLCVDNNDVHSQIMTEMSYIKFDGIVPEFWRGAIEKLKFNHNDLMLDNAFNKINEIYSNRSLNTEERSVEIAKLSVITSDNIMNCTKRGRVDKIKDTYEYITICQTGKHEFIPWGIKGIDTYMKLRPHACYFVGALPATGKTSFAVSCIVEQCKANNRVFFWCGEMTEDQINLRFISQLAGLTLDKLEDKGTQDKDGKQIGGLSTGEWKRVLDAVETMADWDLHMVCGVDMNFTEIASEIRALQKVKPLDCVWLDYYSDILPNNDLINNPRHEQMADVSKDIKSLKKELPVPLVILAQLTRLAFDKRPEKIHLAESSSCERVADGILLLDRPIKGRDKTDREYWQNNVRVAMDDIYGKCAIVVGKNRHGAEGVSFYEFQGNFMQFGDEVNMIPKRDDLGDFANQHNKGAGK